MKWWYIIHIFLSIAAIILQLLASGQFLTSLITGWCLGGFLGLCVSGLVREIRESRLEREQIHKVIVQAKEWRR